MSYAQGLAAHTQTSDVAMELAALQVAALTQVQHGHLEMMKQLEKREARLRDEQLLLNDRTRVLAKRELLLARTSWSATQGYILYSMLHAMMLHGTICSIHVLNFVYVRSEET